MPLCWPAASKCSRVSSSMLPLLLAVLLLLQSACMTNAHSGHHHDGPDPNSAENLAKPIDTILSLHIYAEILTWGLLFPIGMVFGLNRSKYHVPLQVTSTVISLGGMQLAKNHGGRQFEHAAHGNAAPWLFWIMVIQGGLGTFLKMHIMEGSKTRWLAVKLHGALGRLFPVIGYVQMVLGVILGLGFCGGGHLGQCLAHFALGSSFVGYGIIILIMSMYGASWLDDRNISQEFMDSTVIMTFGIIVTFTMHGFIEPPHGEGWSHKDMQHTAMGVLFWTGGALGMWLGRKRRRNVFPALVVSLTGFAMSGHEQETMLSTNVHAIFGYTLMLAGICRIIEICFVLHESHESHEAGQDMGQMRAFQHLTPFLLIVGGLQFMSATEEQLAMVGAYGMDHVTYIVILFCLGFVVHLWSNLLIALYHNSGRNAPTNDSSKIDEEHGVGGFWRAIVSGATSHYRSGPPSSAPTLPEYEAVPNSARQAGESIELGSRGTYSRHHDGSGQPMFDADQEEDDGTDHYWDRNALQEQDAKEIRVQ